MNPANWIPTLLTIAWLLPLAAFVIVLLGYSYPLLSSANVGPALRRWLVRVGVCSTQLIFQLLALPFRILFLRELANLIASPGKRISRATVRFVGRNVRSSQLRAAGICATTCIVGSCICSIWALVLWLLHFPPGADHAHGGELPHFAGTYYSLAQFGNLHLGIGYYVDALTVTMFAMISLIAACVHVYSTGYMTDELRDMTDREAMSIDGGDVIRRGRYHRFFQYLSLFSFSMLGLVLAGNLAMVFVFWELVGICSYFLIGFYFERPTASAAANKAFIVNRIGDFGMLIGLAVIFTALGTLDFADRSSDGATRAGMFSLLRPASADHHLQVPQSMIEAAGSESAAYALLIVAGIGIFCGCVGKSAQFPLLTWLPDAMEGPTPVSALVHSATMVAAGVYLVGRCFPLFVPEVLLTIAVVGCITLFIAATIAMTAFDIKRVLAYSTVSQLGFMMLALGLGGWIAGLFHLVTHAFFKSLLFLCSGSVIHAVGTNDMRQMGGLRRKMPITALTMLIGCLAIIGAGIPGVGGFAGFYSKDTIFEQAYSFASANRSIPYQLLFVVPLIGALITAFYMFRLWYMTFAGAPNDEGRYAHAHESPTSMVGPLVLLSVFAVGIGWHFPFTELSVPGILETARPTGTLDTMQGEWLTGLTIPDEHERHAPEIRRTAGRLAFAAAAVGFLLASVVYLWRWLEPEEIRQSFRPVYRFFAAGWWLDPLYRLVFVKGTFAASQMVGFLDRHVIDRMVHSLALITRGFAWVVDSLVDRRGIDRSIDRVARKTWDLGLSLRRLQTGSLRQYVMYIVIATLSLFAAASLYWQFAVAA